MDSTASPTATVVWSGAVRTAGVGDGFASNAGDATLALAASCRNLRLLVRMVVTLLPDLTEV
jgi:hypothetical protein